MRSEIKLFISQINGIDDVDYGDFMRKANGYLIFLNTSIYAKSNQRVKCLLDEIKNDIQYYPNWDIESTRKRTLLLLDKINSIEEKSPH